MKHSFFLFVYHSKRRRVGKIKIGRIHYSSDWLTTTATTMLGAPSSLDFVISVRPGDCADARLKMIRFQFDLGTN